MIEIPPGLIPYDESGNKLIPGQLVKGKVIWRSEIQDYLEIIELKVLLSRAADALEEEFGPGKADLMTKEPWALIAELRKAAW